MPFIRLPHGTRFGQRNGKRLRLRHCGLRGHPTDECIHSLRRPALPAIETLDRVLPWSRAIRRGRHCAILRLPAELIGRLKETAEHGGRAGPASPPGPSGRGARRHRAGASLAVGSRFREPPGLREGRDRCGLCVLNRRGWPYRRDTARYVSRVRLSAAQSLVPAASRVARAQSCAGRDESANRTVR
jgi:hypothetical protein